MLSFIGEYVNELEYEHKEYVSNESYEYYDAVFFGENIASLTSSEILSAKGFRILIIRTDNIFKPVGSTEKVPDLYKQEAISLINNNLANHRLGYISEESYSKVLKEICIENGVDFDDGLSSILSSKDYRIITIKNRNIITNNIIRSLSNYTGINKCCVTFSIGLYLIEEFSNNPIRNGTALGLFMAKHISKPRSQIMTKVSNAIISFFEPKSKTIPGPLINRNDVSKTKKFFH